MCLKRSNRNTPLPSFPEKTHTDGEKTGASKHSTEQGETQKTEEVWRWKEAGGGGGGWKGGGGGKSTVAKCMVEAELLCGAGVVGRSPGETKTAVLRCDPREERCLRGPITVFLFLSCPPSTTAPASSYNTHLSSFHSRLPLPPPPPPPTFLR